MTWGTDEEVERRSRIRLSVWAYAYELQDDTLASDDAFDELAKRIRPELSTGHKKLDRFFRTHFSPSTGMWVRKHPDLKGLHRTYVRLKEPPCPTTIASTATTQASAALSVLPPTSSETSA